MPQYLYRNPKTGETKEVTQRMSEPHIYTEKGVEWERVFFAPRAAVDTQIDPRSSRDFAAKTANKKGSVGDLFDRSKEMSLKRKDKDGVDTVKQAWAENYSKTRRGRKLPARYLQD